MRSPALLQNWHAQTGKPCGDKPGKKTSRTNKVHRKACGTHRKATTTARQTTTRAAIHEHQASLTFSGMTELAPPTVPSFPRSAAARSGSCVTCEGEVADKKRKAGKKEKRGDVQPRGYLMETQQTGWNTVSMPWMTPVNTQNEASRGSTVNKSPPCGPAGERRNLTVAALNVGKHDARDVTQHDLAAFLQSSHKTSGKLCELRACSLGSWAARKLRAL